MTGFRVRARWVLAGSDDGHRILEDGEVQVEDGRIVEVGRATGVSDSGAIDLGEAVLMPGLIDLDALSDIDHAILDSWHAAPQSRRLQWSSRHAADRTRQHVLDPEDRATMRRFAFAQLLMHGVTSAMPIASEVHSDWAETFDDAVQMTHEAERLGLRVFLGPSYRSGVPVAEPDGLRIHWEPERGEAGLDDALRFIDWAAVHSGPLVTGVLAPCRIETLTDELLARTGAAAQARDALVRLHCLQGTEELRLLRERGTTPIDLLERSGLLNDRLLIPHGIYTDGNSRVGEHGGGKLSKIASAGASIVHCPLTSAHYAAALENFDSYREAGVNLALGTDSFPPDLLRGIDMGSSVAKIMTGRLDAGSHADYLTAATRGGAHALHRPDLGHISIGATADLVGFRLDDMRDGVVDDPLRTLVQHSTARALSLSVIAGDVRVRDGALLGVDTRQLRGEAQRIFGLLREGYGTRTAVPTSPNDLFPPSFPLWEG